MAALVLCASCSSSTRTSEAATSVPIAGGCSQLACHMTGVSAVYSVPEPDDMKPIAGSTDLKSTSVGSIEDLTAFYKEFMTGHGWTFDAAYSVTDPGLAEGKKLGHITDAVYCKDSTGVPGVSIIVGYLNDKPGKALSLAIIDDSGEDSCP